MIEKHNELSEKIIGLFYEVYNALGYGFLEKVYENALAIELRRAGLAVIQQERIKVYYRGAVVGDYFADMVVNGLILLEIKTAKSILEGHEAQTVNYLRATEYEVGLILNFGPRPRVKRKLLDNNKKPNLKK